MRIGEGPTATDRDEARVSDVREDHRRHLYHLHALTPWGAYRDTQAPASRAHDAHVGPSLAPATWPVSFAAVGSGRARPRMQSGWRRRPIRRHRGSLNDAASPDACSDWRCLRGLMCGQRVRQARGNPGPAVRVHCERFTRPRGRARSSSTPPRSTMAAYTRPSRKTAGVVASPLGDLSLPLGGAAEGKREGPACSGPFGATVRRWLSSCGSGRCRP
jgi:hypothetical protein